MRTARYVAASRLLVGLLGGACVDLGGPAPDAGPLPDAADESPVPFDGGALAEVRIHDMTFDPRRLTIAPGTVVRWTNYDLLLHTATEGRPGSPPAWSSPYLASSASWEHRFDDPGTWTYYCVPHSGSMRDAVVEVR